MDIDQLTKIITEEVQSYLANTGDSAQDPDACACPAPAVSGGSIQNGGGSPPQPVQNNPQVSTPSPPPPPAQRILCLINGEIEQATQFFASLGDWASDGIGAEALTCGCADTDSLQKRGVKILSSASELGDRNANLKSYRAVLLPALDPTLAAKTVMGIADDEIGKVLLSALFFKVPVFAAQERLLPNSQTVHGNNLPGMADRIAGYRSDLERMGVVIVPMKEMLSRVRYNAKVATPESGEVITHLITVEDARDLPGPTVRVARGGLVTTMARELLEQRGITIEIVGAG